MTRLLDLNQVAERLGVGYDTAWEFARSGKLPSVRLGGRRKIQVREQDLEAFIEASICGHNPGPNPIGKGPATAGDRRRSSPIAKSPNAMPHAWRRKFHA